MSYDRKYQRDDKIELFRRTELKRALSKLGYCSRSQAQDLILAGSVQVDGRVITDPQFWVELANSRIEVQSKEGPHLKPKTKLIYLALNKPRGYVTTRQDEKGRKTVYELLPEEYRQLWLFPVGRLDQDSEGLLLFTNDSAWAESLLLPQSHIPKTYQVLLDSLPRLEILEEMRRGLQLGQESYLPAKVARISGKRFVISIQEGKNRQVRRMFQAAGCKVKRLLRVAIGSFELGTLGAGKVRLLTPAEKERLAF